MLTHGFVYFTTCLISEQPVKCKHQYADNEGRLSSRKHVCMTFKTPDLLQENSDKSVIELQQYAKKNKPNLHILNKLQEEMKKLAKQRVRIISCMLFLM